MDLALRPVYIRNVMQDTVAKDDIETVVLERQCQDTPLLQFPVWQFLRVSRARTRRTDS